MNVDGDGKTDLTRVVCAANSNVGGQLVVDEDGNLRSTGDAEIVREVGVGQVKLAVLAKKTSDRLAGAALGGWPLRLLVAGRAGVGAVHAFATAVGATARASIDGLDVAVSGAAAGTRVLNSNPTT